MPDPRPAPVSLRIQTPPRWGFFKGLFAGSVIEVPALALGVWVLARLGLTDPQVDAMRILRLTAVFAGVAGVLTAAGIGRLAAVASVDPVGGRRHAVAAAANAHAIASIGLVIIAVIPHGHLPDHARGWLVVAGVGAAIGALTGAVIGAICGGAAPVHIADVMALARTPGHALSQLLDPRDLRKLGTRVRSRTQQLFHGMFEPGDKPPEDPAKGPPDEPTP
jgi:hypothetical protein